MSHYQRKLYGSATVGARGQVVIPADARDELGIAAGDRLYVVGSPEMKWVGFVPEDELRVLINKITADVENYKQLLDN